MSEMTGVVAALLASVVMAPAVAHVLELPGKLRLSHADYPVVQRIYYPGFTVAGIGELLGIAVTAVALASTEVGSLAFPLRTVAAAALLGMQAVYWLRVHPVNRFWLKAENLDRVSSGFFAYGRRPGATDGDHLDWTELRARWESGHAIRAALAVIGVVALVVALA